MFSKHPIPIHPNPKLGTRTWTELCGTWTGRIPRCSPLWSRVPVGAPELQVMFCTFQILQNNTHRHTYKCININKHINILHTVDIVIISSILMHIDVSFCIFCVQKRCFFLPDFCVFHLKVFSGSLQVTSKVFKDQATPLCHYALFKNIKNHQNSNQGVLPRRGSYLWW